MGFTVKTVPHGPDGGIDATLYKTGLDVPVAVVQCKAWSKPVKVEQVCALAGVMHKHKVRRAPSGRCLAMSGGRCRSLQSEPAFNYLMGRASSNAFAH
ncbi:restriction endonuclease [Cupriavidus sp. LEh21]|nr:MULTISPECIES: restriction endonuclease [unclassified Cupriavidus]MDK2661459.1 restriction endonuclease [Cupriavidus sp. LEh21]